jgi:hypothetical protein
MLQTVDSLASKIETLQHRLSVLSSQEAMPNTSSECHAALCQEYALTRHQLHLLTRLYRSQLLGQANEMEISHDVTFNTKTSHPSAWEEKPQ